MPRKSIPATEQIADAGGKCDRCKGKGGIPQGMYNYMMCPICKGTGKAKAKKRHKYNVGSKEDRTYNGVTFHSVLERRVAAWLDMRKGKYCPSCNGHGFWGANALPCAKCKGTGWLGGDVLSWERQVKFDLLVTGVYTDVPSNRHPYPISVPFANDKGRRYQYIADFKVYFADGHEEIWEVKSWWLGKKSKITGKRGKGKPHFTAEAKLKWAIFKANHPEFKTRVITAKDLPKGF